MSVNEMLMAAAGASGPSEYVEDVFSTWLYQGTATTQTITNGIDLAGKGGLVWIKNTSAARNHFLFDTNRGVLNEINTNTTEAQASLASSLTAFNSNGFTLGGATGINNAVPFVSWTFREAPKFFDVVTYSGTSSARTVPHNLGSVPGMIIIKSTNTAGTNWVVYHRSLGNQQWMVLNGTNAVLNAPTAWNATDPTSTVFSLGDDNDNSNKVGSNYVAYLFAHNAGGFGDAGTDNIISCGSLTLPGSGNATVDLGWEPQFILMKQTNGGGNWFLFDSMRGIPTGGNENWLFANSSAAEATGSNFIELTATGFTAIGANWGADTQYIYMAIRIPMKKPTSGTQVFETTNNVTSSTPYQLTSLPYADMVISKIRISGDPSLETRLTASRLKTNTTDADLSSSATWSRSGFQGFTPWNTGDNHVVWNFRRAPGFFDTVCYTGTGVARTVNHNLGAIPELLIVKRRDATSGWSVYSAELAASGVLVLNMVSAATTTNLIFNGTRPTASVFSVGTSSSTNASGGAFVAYLFASLPGVSKVGSYTGNGSSQTINCGFSAGARFVLIKRTDSTGDWYVWDTARGIVAANDPRLSLNSTAAEVTTDDSIDPASSGFSVNQLAATNINVNAATYIYLAIA